MKPYYEQDGITIYHGDCSDVLPSLAPATLVLTDPPYNAINRPTSGLRSFDKGVADSAPVDVPAVAALLWPLFTGSAYVWCSGEQFTGWTLAFTDRGATTRKCAWWKSNPSPMNGERLWLSAMELCVFARKDGAIFNEHCAHPIWRGATDQENLGHTTPKPRWLFSRLIAASTIPGDTVLDPFMGSGTTLRAAKDLGRKAVGIEIEERYCEIAAERLSQQVLGLEAA